MNFLLLVLLYLMSNSGWSRPPLVEWFVLGLHAESINQWRTHNPCFICTWTVLGQFLPLLVQVQTHGFRQGAQTLNQNSTQAPSVFNNAWQGKSSFLSGQHLGLRCLSLCARHSAVCPSPGSSHQDDTDVSWRFSSTQHLLCPGRNRSLHPHPTWWSHNTNYSPHCSCTAVDHVFLHQCGILCGFVRYLIELKKIESVTATKSWMLILSCNFKKQDFYWFLLLHLPFVVNC